jgi:hypothetical protein
VPKIYKPFTDHSSDEIFARIYLKNAGVFARQSHDLSLHMRLYLLGLQRVSNRGHAPFKPKEIQQLLRKKDGKNYTEKQIRNEIDRLASVGILSSKSNIRCLLYPMELISLKTDKKNAAECPEHGTHSSWSGFNRDWAHNYLPEGVIEETAIPPIGKTSELNRPSDFPFPYSGGTNVSY